MSAIIPKPPIFLTAGIRLLLCNESRASLKNGTRVSGVPKIAEFSKE